MSWTPQLLHVHEVGEFWCIAQESDAQQLPAGAIWFTEKELPILKESTKDILKLVYLIKQIFTSRSQLIPKHELLLGH